jgi:hypothetical protein
MNDEQNIVFHLTSCPAAAGTLKPEFFVAIAIVCNGSLTDLSPNIS